LVLDVWPGKARGETEPIGEEKSVEVKRFGFQVKGLTNVSRPTLTVFRPAKDKDTGSAVLVCPGGGYNIVAWGHEGKEPAAWLNSLGVTAVVLKYRVPRRPGQPKDGPFLAPLQDVQRALSLVRHEARDWGVDPNRIGVLGISAGGYLAASVSTGFDRRAYESVDAVDQISCRPDFAVLVYPGGLIARGEEELTPEMRVRKDCPPMLLVHASDDPVKAENSVLMYLALKRAGVPAELHVHTSGGHGFALRPGAQPCSSWPQRCADWLQTQGFLKPGSGR